MTRKTVVFVKIDPKNRNESKVTSGQRSDSWYFTGSK